MASMAAVSEACRSPSHSSTSRMASMAAVSEACRSPSHSSTSRKDTTSDWKTTQHVTTELRPHAKKNDVRP
ncbi:hypothetical protein ACOMHN_060913 [Nucella lapillus]